MHEDFLLIVYRVENGKDVPKVAKPCCENHTKSWGVNAHRRYEGAIFVACVEVGPRCSKRGFGERAGCLSYCRRGYQFYRSLWEPTTKTVVINRTLSQVTWLFSASGQCIRV